MGRVKIGKVGLAPKGAFDPNREGGYERLDLVSNGSYSFISLKDENTSPLSDRTAWMPHVKIEITGDVATADLVTGGSFDSTRKGIILTNGEGTEVGFIDLSDIEEGFEDMCTTEMLSAAQQSLEGQISDVNTNLQEQIDAIVSGSTTVSLSPNKTAIFVDEDTDVTLTATSTKDTATKDGVPGIQIFRKNGNDYEPISGGSAASGKTAGATVTEHPEAEGTIKYKAKFIVSGIELEREASVSAVRPIYYGAGQSDAVLNTNAMTAHSAVASPSFTQSITTAANDYIYFEVPNSMSNISKLQLYDDPTFPTDLSVTTATTTREGYKAFKTVNARQAGTHTYKVVS